MSSVGKKKEEKQPIFEQIGQPLFPIEISDYTIENFFAMSEVDRQERERMERELERKRNDERGRKEREDRESHREETRGGNDEEEEEENTTFAFPIVDTPTLLGDDIKMKNIPPFVLPNFFGMSTEDPDTFMFEFDIVFRTYGYTNDAKKTSFISCNFERICIKMVHGVGRSNHSILG
jgi:hypothetical protein